MSSCHGAGHEYVWENRSIVQLIILALGGVDVVCFTRGLLYPQETDSNTHWLGSLAGSRGSLQFL